MIDSIRIRGLRGIRTGEIAGLPQLGVLIGPNGCGKSTILEALLLAATPDLGYAVGRCVQRRMEVPFGSRFLFAGPHEGHASEAELEAHLRAGEHLRIHLEWTDELAKEISAEGWHALITSTAASTAQQISYETLFKPDNSYKSNKLAGEPGSESFVRFLDQRIGSARSPLHKVLSYARHRGAKAPAEDLIREVVPDLETIEILTIEDQPVVHLSFKDRSVPAALSGDGMESLVRLALELSSPLPGTFLIEEPEAHQHIAAMARSARVIASAVKTGSQVILSTHSLEFLDLLIGALGEEHIDKLGVLRLWLYDGALTCVHHHGEDVRVARATVEMDLR